MGESNDYFLKNSMGSLELCHFGTGHLGTPDFDVSRTPVQPFAGLR